MSKRTSRETILFFLYQKTMNSNEFNFFIKHFDIKNIDINFCQKIIQKINENNSIIENEIKNKSKNWKISRISLIDLCLLKIGISEMLLIDNPTDKKIVINEIVEISKIYSSENSPKFLNGILDNFSIHKN